MSWASALVFGLGLAGSIWLLGWIEERYRPVPYLAVIALAILLGLTVGIVSGAL